ncbi:MAG TPA: hypothetical protein VF765_08545 [Polyangiaceae bacterium]
MRRATVRNVADLPAVVGWSMELNGYVNKTYDIHLKTGLELFGTPTVHWHFETDSLDKISALNQKLLQDRTYIAMLEKAKPYWMDGSLKDEIVQFP